MTAPDIHVVHLVRRQNGPEPFRAFLASYVEHPAGAGHRLALVYKGFDDLAQTAPYEALAADVAHETYHVNDEGFDVNAYLLTARQFSSRLLCFLNSFSVLLANGWLGKLATGLGQPGVGLAGATGSWESPYTNLRRAVAGQGLRPTPRGLRQWARCWRALAGTRRDFAPFPNYHLRTNAFLIERERILDFDPTNVRAKDDAHRFESGREGLTARVRRAGLEPVVVDRAGRVWRKEDWPASHTFRSGEQDGLLVADNRTRDFTRADALLRRVLSRYAWGQEEVA